MNKILVIADQQGKKQPAVHRGIELAKRAGMAIHVAAFIHEPFVETTDDPKLALKLKKAALKARQEKLDETVADAELDGVKVTREVIWEKRIGNWVVEQASTGLYSMVIKTGHRSETFSYTPLDWQLLRENPIPTMIVAEKTWRQKNHILCAIDLGATVRGKKELNHRVIEEGKQLAQILDGELHFCYTIEVPTVLVDLDLVDVKQIRQKRTKKARLQFEKLAELYDLENTTLHIRAGKAEKVIPSIADKLKVRMVVMGTVGRKGVKGKIVGNTAEKVLHHLRTDVLALKR